MAKRNNMYSKEQKEALRQLVIGERLGYLKNPYNVKYYSDKLDKLNVPFSVQNKAVNYSQENPNLYSEKIVKMAIKKK